MKPNQKVKDKSIAVLIVTYNGMKWLAKCLESCMDYPIIIVDNGSTDGTIEYIEKNFPQNTLLKQNKNLGFGQANNLGIKLALEQNVEYVFLLNQDAYLHSNTIEVLIAAQRRNPTYGILSPIHLNGKGNRLDRNFSNYVSYGSNPDFYSDFILKKPLQEIYEVPFVNAAGWLLSKKILEIVGGFDPIFFHYGEDDNYCQRVRYHGFKIGIVPKAFLNHDREGRSNVGVHHLDSFLKLERKLKSRYGNINTDEFKDIDKHLRKKKKELIKLFLKLKFSKLAIVRREIYIAEKVFGEVSASREKNILKGKHYLEEEE